MCSAVRSDCAREDRVEIKFSLGSDDIECDDDFFFGGVGGGDSGWDATELSSQESVSFFHRRGGSTRSLPRRRGGVEIERSCLKSRSAVRKQNGILSSNAESGFMMII